MDINKKEKVAVIGLGYVGLPLAVLAANKGYDVHGLERTEEKAKLVNDGVNFLEDRYLKEVFRPGQVQATTDPGMLATMDIILVCVPTPVDDQYTPDLGPVKSAVTAIVANMGDNKPLVVIESTINPGVCEEVVEPVFAAAGKKVGVDYELAHSPERINPGDPNWDVTNIPRVVGAMSREGLARAVKFYEDIIDGSIAPMATIREAEAVKVVENSFRDINIAFVNELAKSFDKMDINVTNVINGAATKPYAFMAHYPSCGVGGHCIPVDPYYLIERAKLSGFDHKFLRAARTINNSMPSYTVELLQDKLNDVKLPLNGTKIGVMGISYKPNVNDIRESPALDVIDLLKEHKADVLTYDPFIPKHSTENSLDELLDKSEAVILVTHHDAFVNMDISKFKEYGIKVVIDGRNSFDRKSIEDMGIIYKGIGR